MSTVVYQELHPYYETRFIESRTLSLKLNSPQLNLPKSVGFPQTTHNSLQEFSSKSDNGASNRSSFSNMFGIEALSSSHRKSAEKDYPVYIHPLVKRSSSMLSQKSLEMCTESLGCETGTSFMECSSFFPSISSEGRKPRRKLESKKEVNQVNFPPPLTTISGSNTIQVKPYREEGRLVIKAVSAPPRTSYLQAERQDGRLKLSLVRDCSSDIKLDHCYSDEEDDIVSDYETTDSNEHESGVRTEEEEKQAEKSFEKEMSFEKEESAKNGSDLYLGEEMIALKRELEVTMGLGKIQSRLSRCKEGSQGNKRLINWEPFWVAT